MRNRLISTVGTSLLSNIRNLRGEEAERYAELKRHVDDEKWGQVNKELLKIEPSERICGAEINSIADAVKRGKLTQLEFIEFLVSDTEDGRIMGRLLENYFTERAIKDLDTLQNVKFHVIEDLQDEKPPRFKVYGLRNLVRKLGEIARDHGADTLVIDATGGYKAQIAVAVVFGQALSIPVLYRHERFSEIIDFPPMPITFDYSLLGKNADLLAAFERGDTLTYSEVDDLDEKVRVLLEEVEVDGENVFALGAVGQIFLTGFRLRFPRSRQLTPVSKDDRSDPSFTDDHFPKGFKEFVIKVWSETEWIKTTHTVPFEHQKAIKGTSFYVREGKLLGTFQDKDKFGARFVILTNAEGEDQLAWAADQLNQKYGSGN
jgi:putative CRISPR-associated protein (TIGR02619 family)